MPIMLVMPGICMKKFRGVFCIALVLLLMFSLSLTAFAEGNVEEAVDAVAEQEAAEAAAAAEAAEEAAKVNDVVDLDETSEDVITDEVEIAEATPVEGSSSGLSGPILTLIVGAVLIVFGLLIVFAGNKKIKANKKGTAGK